MRHLSPLAGVTALLLVSTSLQAQQPERAERPQRAMAVSLDSLRQFFLRGAMAPDRAVLGITIGESGTEGVRVAEVTEDGPAARAGIRAGDHLAEIDGVDLRVAPGDMQDQRLREASGRRLQRALERVTAGGEVALRVRSGAETRTVRVRTVRADALAPRGAMPSVGSGTIGNPDRATLGMTVGSTGTTRDTLGAFVSAVVAGGPAERAGIYEGARIVSVNGVSMRVDSADLRDPVVGRARAERLTRELRQLSAGDEVTLRVWESGRTRDVRVQTARASEVYGRRSAAGVMELRPGNMIQFGPGMFEGRVMPLRPGAARGAWRIETEGDSTVIRRLTPGEVRSMDEGRVRIRTGPGVGVRLFRDTSGVTIYDLDELSEPMRQQLLERMEGARRRLDETRQRMEVQRTTVPRLRRML